LTPIKLFTINGIKIDNTNIQFTNVISIINNLLDRKYIITMYGNIIIITCKPLDKKIQMLKKYLILKKITHVKNINSLITICFFYKKL
jgi:hypothetical protein